MAAIAAYTPRLASAAAKYIKTLDRPTRERFEKKIREIARDPFDPTYSKPLTGSNKRSSQIGGYRLLFLVI